MPDMPGEATNLESGGNTGAAQPQGSTWETFQETPEGNQEVGVSQNLQQGGEMSAGDVKTDVLPPGQQAGAESGQQQPGNMEPPMGQEAAQTFTPEQFATLKAQNESLAAEMETIRQRADFYQTQFNERYLSETERTAQAGAQAQPGRQPVAQPGGQPLGPVEDDTLPEGVLPPEEWQSQSDMVPYFNHQFSQQLNRNYQQNIKPTFDRLNTVIGAIEEMIVTTQFKDFKEVTGKVLGDLFTMDPAGNVIGIKDPATLAWIQHSPMPKMALYKYATSKRAPELIKQAKQDATSQLLDQINQKPRITQPEGGGGAPAQSGALDWTTPKEQAERILGQRGLI